MQLTWKPAHVGSKKHKEGKNRFQQAQSVPKPSEWSHLVPKKNPKLAPKGTKQQKCKLARIGSKDSNGLRMRKFGSRQSVEPLGTYPPFNLLVPIRAFWRHSEAVVKLKLIGPSGANWRFLGLEELGWTILKLEQFLELLEAMWASSRAIFLFSGARLGLREPTRAFFWLS